MNRVKVIKVSTYTGVWWNVEDWGKNYTTNFVAYDEQGEKHIVVFYTTYIHSMDGSYDVPKTKVVRAEDGLEVDVDILWVDAGAC